ncbi:MAG: hypothetical protein QGI45_03305 [Myxococcota bacterium]|nr:hypothetical protein [Myxococcota bacterium]
MQDTEAADVWTLWDVDYRDVIILNELNKYYSTYNLTTNDLDEAEHRATLKATLLTAAGL